MIVGHFCEVCEEVRLKAAMGGDHQHVVSAQELENSLVRAKQTHRGIQHLAEPIIEVRGAPQPRAALVQLFKPGGLGRERPLALKKRPFRLFALGDVTRDLGGPDHDSARIAYRRNGDRDGDASAVLRNAGRIEMLDALALAQLRDNSALLILQLRRDDERDGLSDRLLCRVSKGAHRPGVPGLDDAAGVVGGLDDRCEQCARALEASLLADVAGILRSADDPALPIQDRRYCQRDFDPATILGDARGLEVIDPLAAPDFLQDLLLFRVQLRRNDDRDRLADDLVSLVAKDARGTCIPGADLSVEGFADDRILRGVDDRGEERKLHGVGRVGQPACELSGAPGARRYTVMVFSCHKLRDVGQHCRRIVRRLTGALGTARRWWFGRLRLRLPQFLFGDCKRRQN